MFNPDEIFKTETGQCPSCGMKGSAGIGGLGQKPKTGDLGICGRCGTINILTINGDKTELKAMDKERWKQISWRKRRQMKRLAAKARRIIAMQYPW